MSRTADARIKALEKIYELSPGEKMSRRTFEKYANKHREILSKFGNPIEAIYAAAGIMNIADTFGFTKYAEDGGKVVTLSEFITLMDESTERTNLLADVCNIPYFRAIDKDGNGYIDRKEWDRHLKARNTYVNEEQAMKSFDSLDTNHDNRISMEEYLQACRKYWASKDQENVKNLYGTQPI